MFFFKERSILIYFASQYHVLLQIAELKATDENDRLSNSKKATSPFYSKPIGAGS